MNRNVASDGAPRPLRLLTLKRLLVGLGIVLLVLAAGVGVVFYLAFGNNRPIVNEQVLAPGVEVVKDGFVSAAILDVDSDKVALIDAGVDKSGKAILAALAKRNLSPTSVIAIFLTHGHGDHIAACPVFHDAEVFAFPDDLPMLGSKIRVAHPLKDREVITVGHLRVEAFAVPGHTPGSAAYLARGVLFFGDSAGGGVDGRMMPAVRFFSKDPRQNVASLKALEAKLQPRAAEVKVLAFAHSGPLDGFEPFAAFASRE